LWRCAKIKKNAASHFGVSGVFCIENSIACCGGMRFLSGLLVGGRAGLAPWNAQALATFPQTFAADAEFAGQFGFGHVILVFENKMLEIVL
jgi:hypothetical protein